MKIHKIKNEELRMKNKKNGFLTCGNHSHKNSLRILHIDRPARQ